MAWLAWLIFLAVPCGFIFGLYVGKTWGRLPDLGPGQIVRFKGPSIGLERRLVVREVTHSLGAEGTQVILTTPPRSPR